MRRPARYGLYGPLREAVRWRGRGWRYGELAGIEDQFVQDQLSTHDRNGDVEGVVVVEVARLGQSHGRR